jgi:ABC-type sugar transport system ATPase subunit
MAAVTLQQLSKRFPNDHVAVHETDLSIRDGELVVLVGPSGCGKSTLLRLIAGLESPSGGRILLDDQDVSAAAPQERDVAMVFQSYALYPHLTVRDNLAYGLRVRGVSRDERERRIASVAEALELETLLGRRPAQLSGGQRQRVALGRAMVREPRVFLFDEPLSNLDPALRVQARAELLRLHRRLRTTIVYVTHDQEEAMTLAGRVAVMRAGVIEQFAPPMEVYRAPVNTFVAQFLGSPAMNLWPASMLAGVPAGCALVGLRPADIVIGRAGPLRATVDVVEPRGHDALVHLALDAAPESAAPGPPRVIAIVAAEQMPPRGADVRLDFRREALHFFDAGGRAVPHRGGA